MDLLLYLGLFLVSLAVLLKGSDWFIDAAETIGLSFGISPFIIGVTIIAFGTSLPELASSLAAVFVGESEIVIGNVVGSNIANIALVLATVAILGKQVQLPKDILKTDMPLLIVSAVLLYFTVRDQKLTLLEAILLICALVIFLIYSFNNQGGDKDDDLPKATWQSYLFLVIGGLLVYFGAEYTVKAIVNLSGLLGISSEVIALSMVALGTSLPELVVSIQAARKGNTEMAVGNVLGSNIFNTYAVMGIPSLFGTLTIPADVIHFSLPLMIAITFLFGIMSLTKSISRWEGWMLFLFYVYFMIQLFE